MRSGQEEKTHGRVMYVSTPPEKLTDSSFNLRVVHWGSMIQEMFYGPLVCVW